MVVFTASMYITSAGLGAGSLVCPALLPAAIVVFDLAEASALMTISPIDPVTAVLTTAVAAGTGPV